MKTHVSAFAGVVLLCGFFCSPACGLTPQIAAGDSAGTQVAAAAASSAGTVVPRLVQFSGTVTELSGKPATGSVTITFSLYELQEGGAPLWSETQSVVADAHGHYTAFLGAASPDGLPLDLFATGSARWLGIAPALSGVGEQPRALLVGVPYALKAADADTLGGLPPSAFVESGQASTGTAVGGAAGTETTTGTVSSKVANPAGQGQTARDKNAKPNTSVANYLPYWNGTANVGNSAIYQSGTNLGIGTTSPTNVLQVNGSTPIYSTGTGAGLEFQDRAGGTSPSGEWYSTGSVARFWRSDKGDVLGITSNGYMGIGTTSPSVNLQVAGTTSTGNIQVRASNLATSGSSISYVGADANAGKTVAIVGADGLGTGPMKTASGFFGTFTNQPAGIVTNNVERMRVTTTGQVGIGTTTPAATLEVNGTAQFDQAVTFASSQTFSGSTGVFSGATSPVLSVTNTQSNGGLAQLGTTIGSSAAGVYGAAGGYGVYGSSSNVGVYGTGGSSGVYGVSLNNVGVNGLTQSSSGYGVVGTNSANGSNGQLGTSVSGSATGVYGSGSSDGVYGTGGNYGVYGTSSGYGVYGTSTATSGGYSGVYGSSASDGGAGVTGTNTSTYANAFGVYGETSNGYGVAGEGGIGAYGYGKGADGYGVWGVQGNDYPTSYAGYFTGPVDVVGTLTKSGGAFKIDHPLDPANKYLFHSFVESPEMKNVYDGVVVVDAKGEAWIDLPQWFEALNSDFRYQLTAVGAPAPGLYIAEEISGNRFKIAGGKPGGKVSWQVTGIRQDAWARAHRIPVEEEKPQAERGFYLHPELYGQPKEKSIASAYHRPAKLPTGKLPQASGASERRQTPKTP